MKKVDHERELARQKAAELHALENDRQILTQERAKLGRLAEKNQAYRGYLLSVVRQCKQVMATEGHGSNSHKCVETELGSAVWQPGPGSS